MTKRLKAFGYFALFWMAFFILSRLFFILYQFNNSAQYSLGELLATFWHGSKLDISTTGYYLLLPVLVVIPGFYLRGEWYRYFMRWYTWFLIILSSVIVVSDANLYPYWGFRMDYTPMLYLKTPAEAMASVSTTKVILFFSTIILISLLSIYVYNRLIDRTFGGLPQIRFRLAGVLFFMFLWAALIIPIRGGFGLAPINAGTVYFSKKMYLNHTSVNAVWNVGTSAFTQKPVTNPYIFGDMDEASALVDSLTLKRGIPVKVLNSRRPNVLIIVLEGFSGYLIGPLGGDTLVTPNFSRYSKEGILFTNFYASGNRTDKAIPAILNGYPAQPAQSIMREPKKSQSLPSLVKILVANGYSSAFWYGGDINFANFNSFVIGSGFDRIITKDNFDPVNYNSKWGVHDHVLFNILKDSMKSVSEPFLKVVLTLSSHEPFDVPMEPVFDGHNNMTDYRNSVYYADKSLGDFLDWAKKSDWWRNTLVIMVADHCARVNEDVPLYSSYLFRIPMLWIGGALSEKGKSIERIGSQVDIPVTLLDQLGLDASFPFAKDLLNNESEEFAFYVYNDGFGFITNSSTVIYDNKLKNAVIKEGSDPVYAENAGKSFLQVLYNDYLKR